MLHENSRNWVKRLGRHRISAAVTHTENSRNFTLLYLPVDCQVCGNGRSRRQIAMWKIRKIQPIFCQTKRLRNRVCTTRPGTYTMNNGGKKNSREKPEKRKQETAIFPHSSCVFVPGCYCYFRFISPIKNKEQLNTGFIILENWF